MAKTLESIDEQIKKLEDAKELILVTSESREILETAVKDLILNTGFVYTLAYTSDNRPLISVNKPSMITCKWQLVENKTGEIVGETSINEAVKMAHERAKKPYKCGNVRRNKADEILKHLGFTINPVIT